MTKPKWKEVRVLQVKTCHRVLVAPMHYDSRKALLSLVIGLGLVVFVFVGGALIGRPVLGDFTPVVFFAGLFLGVLGFIRYGAHEIIKIDVRFPAPVIGQTILLDGWAIPSNYEERATLSGKRTFVPIK